MSCISSNFSSFFLNSLNDPSEFTKYLSNGELKLSPFEEFQVQTQTSQQQQLLQQQQHPQYSQQQAQLPLNGAGSAYYANNATNNNNIHAGSNGIASSNNHLSTNNSNNVGSASMANGGAMAAGMPPSSSSSSSNMEVFNGAAHIEAANYASQQQQQSSITHPQQQQQSHQHLPNHHHSAHPHPPHPSQYGHVASAASGGVAAFHHNHHLPSTAPPPHYASTPQRWPTSIAANGITTTPGSLPHVAAQPGTSLAAMGAQHFDGSFEFLKYLRHSNDYSEAGEAQGSGNGGSPASNGVHVNHQLPSHHHHQQTQNHHHPQQQQQSPSSSLIDLDSSTKHKSRSSRKVAALLSSVSRASNSLDSTSLDVFDHDSKHTMFDLHHMTNSSNSNESNLEMSSVVFPNSHLNASNSNTSSEGAAAGSTDFAMLHSSSNAPKPLANFVIKDNFEVHPSHKVEEGIFQHMNKLPPKKKENLKQLGVRFTGQMTLADKSIVVENFIRFCQEYDIKDHRPFLSLNQSGLNKPDQIKFARYLGQGLPTFTLFCIYSNFKNLFCTKRTEIYTKDGYNLPYILDKTKRFLSNTTADLKNMVHQQSNDSLEFSPTSASTSTISAPLSNASAAEPTAKCAMPKLLENLVIFENFDVHETHRVEDGICTHITRLPPKKQEILKQFGIQSNQAVTVYEKYIIIENFIKFCNEYKISDHRPFLDFHESGLPKSEQIKFARYLGQGLPNLTLNKIHLAFKDMLGMSRIEKLIVDGYNLDTILKKKKKNLYNRMHAAGTSDNCFSSSNLASLF